MMLAFFLISKGENIKKFAIFLFFPNSISSIFSERGTTFSRCKIGNLDVGKVFAKLDKLKAKKLVLFGNV